MRYCKIVMKQLVGMLKTATPDAAISLLFATSKVAHAISHDYGRRKKEASNHLLFLLSVSLRYTAMIMHNIRYSFNSPLFLA